MDSLASTIEYPVSGADFYPTLLDLAEIDRLPDQHVDGLSLKPLMEGKSLSERPLYWHYPHYGNQGGDPSSIIREGEWKLIHYWEDGSQELYNLTEDSGEQNDVSEENPEITARLGKDLMDWLMEVDANMAQEDSEYDEELDRQRHNTIVNELWPKLEKQRLDYLSEDFEPNDDWWGSQVTKD